jgi:hypothetical protein
MNDLSPVRGCCKPVSAVRLHRKPAFGVVDPGFRNDSRQQRHQPQTDHRHPILGWSFVKTSNHVSGGMKVEENRRFEIPFSSL